MREDKKKKRIKILKLFIVLIFAGMLVYSPMAVTGEGIKESTNNGLIFEVKNSNSNIEYKSTTISSVIFEQLPYEPDEPWIFRDSTKDSGYRVWDEYWDLSEEFCHIIFWGLCVTDSGSDCDPMGIIFEIIFWDELLGNPTYTYQLKPHAKQTGKFYNGSELWRWKADLDPCSGQIPHGWMSIQNIYSPYKCRFLWAGSGQGNLYCYQEGATDPDCDSDCAFQFMVCDCETPTDIVCDSIGMNFGKIAPGDTITGQIYVCNEGLEGSYMGWYVDTYHVPKWGTWTFTPASGDYVAKGDCAIINVICMLTNVTGKYNGTILVYNARQDPEDYCEIETSVEVTRTRSHNTFDFSFIQQFSLFDKLLPLFEKVILFFNHLQK